MLEEFRLSLVAELDCRQVAQHLLTISHQLRDLERIVIPLPIDDYTTERVLTMDFHLRKIAAVSGVERTEFDGEALADDLFRAYLQQILIDGVFHADPHPGNVFLTGDHRLALLGLGIDRGPIIDGFQKVANRIALAALIVGAAMLMRVLTSFTILGYPGFAMLLFILAAGGGFWMAWTIRAGDVRTRQH